MLKIIHELIVAFVKFLPKSIVYIFAKKYVAGESLEEAVKVVKNLNEKGIVATMDILGEAISESNQAYESRNHCIEILDKIHEENLDANLSVKPTSLALGLDNDLCFNLFEEILSKAESYGNMVRIDMEDSPYTTATIDLFQKLKENHSNVGIVVQAYLKRTIEDVKKENMSETNYRLCKGIYVENKSIAFKDKQRIRDSYLEILDYMLDNGNYVGIATHDSYLINKSYEMIKDKNISKDKFEFQMLYGVTENLRDKINSDGNKLRVYVPYGIQWYAYSIRRLQENPKLAWYITKSLFTFN